MRNRLINIIKLHGHRADFLENGQIMAMCVGVARKDEGSEWEQVTLIDILDPTVEAVAAWLGY